MIGLGHVVRPVRERAARATIDLLGTAGTATIHEAQGRTGYLSAQIRPIQLDRSISGSAVTVSCHPGDNLMLHAAAEVCRPGDVLVVSTTAPSTHGMFGDLLATSLVAHGVVGLVIDAGVRDTRDLRAMGFPVWSRWISCEGTVKATAGSVNIPICIGGQIVHPGDVICADDDGVVAVPRDTAEAVLAAAHERIDKEATIREQLANGALTTDIYGLRDVLAALNVTIERE